MGAAAVPIAIGASVIGAGVAAFGTIQAGQAAAAQADYQAKVAANNKIIAEHKAADARSRGERAERIRRIQTEQLLGRQRVSAAARGVEVDTGSALDLQLDTAEIGELDALTIRSNAEREAVGFENQAIGFEAERGLRLSESRNAQTATALGTVGTVASGVGSVAGQWYEFNPPGTTGTSTPNPINRNRTV